MSELLAQIRANPLDRDLRLVFADEIAATDPARGELVTIELQLEGAAPDRRAALARRRRELRRDHAWRWWGLPPHAVWSRDGFATRAVMQRGVAYPERLFAGELVTEVEIDGAMDASTMARVVAEPHVYSVVLRDQRDDGWAAPLARARLVSLAVIDCDLRDVALPACRGLSLWSDPRRARWPHAAQLEHLDLARDAPVDLVRAATGLRSLRWHRAELRHAWENSRATVAELLGHRTLREIELFEPTIEGFELSWLVAAPPERAVVELPDHLLEIERLEPGAWRLFVDGIRRSLRWRRIQTIRGRYFRQETRQGDAWTDGDLAPLDSVALGVPLGRWPRLAADHAVLWASDATEGALVRIPDDGPVEITIENVFEIFDD